MTNIAELRGKSSDELKEMALALKKELFNLRFQVASGELQNTARFQMVRRDVARVKTVLNDPSQVNAPAKQAAKKTKAAKVVKETKVKKATKTKAGE
jgi:large subunit ribosomal protein L29